MSPTDKQIRSYQTLSPRPIEADEDKHSCPVGVMAKGQSNVTAYLIYLVAIATFGPAQFGYHLVGYIMHNSISSILIHFRVSLMLHRRSSLAKLTRFPPHSPRTSRNAFL